MPGADAEAEAAAMGNAVEAWRVNTVSRLHSARRQAGGKPDETRQMPGDTGHISRPAAAGGGGGGLQNRGWVFSYGRPENFKTESSGSGGLGTVPGDLGQDWGAGEGRAWKRNRAVLPQMPGFTPGGSKARALEAGYRELLGSWPLFVFLEVERGAQKTKSAYRRDQAGSR